MTKAELKRCAIKAMGEKGWQTLLAKKLRKDPRTIRRWASGATAIPETAAIAIRAVSKQ